MSYIDGEIDKIIQIEGGYVNDPADSGGETNFGITVATARRYGYQGEMKNMSRQIAHDIYKAEYWEGPGFDKVALVSEMVASKLFDIGVNSGQHRASTYLQRCLNVMNNQAKYWKDLKVDGKIGRVTLDALSGYYARRGSQGLTVLHTALTCLQGAGYIELAERREKDEKFVYGWIANRVVK